MVLNTDGDAVSYIADGIATDITDKVMRKLDISPVD